MNLPHDWIDLLAAFASEGAEVVVVGGYAVAFHARPRATKDIDFILRGGPNLERAARALTRFGAPRNVVDATRAMNDDDVVYLGQPPLRIDLLRRIDGVSTDDVFAHAVTTKWGDAEVRIIGLDDLIANKKASARPQDLIDVEILERSKR